MEIEAIEINTDDLYETEKFYSEKMGFKLLRKDDDSISFEVGSSVLSFVKSKNIQPNYHFAMNIPKNKLEEAIHWTSVRFELIVNDEKEIVSNFESWNAKAIYFFDNNDNILEFIARYDLNNASDQNFSSASILSISEIGIVVDDPLSKASELHESINLEYFDKSKKSETFVGLGDDDGLLIFVQKNRKWFPTQKVAIKHAVKIQIRTNGIQSEIEFKNT